MTLPALLDKQDGFELVRDAIAVIIADNAAAQVILAAAEPDPQLWKLRVFIERSNPWEVFLNEPEEGAPPDYSPVVNVWYESGDFDESKGSAVTGQAQTGQYNVDVYGWGISRDVVAGGYSAGDEEAAKTAQRGIRFCRNFLMAEENTYLGFARGDLVWQRWTQSIRSFQPDIQNEAAHQILGMRLTLRVTCKELAPAIVAADTLKEIGVIINRAEDGLLIGAADYIFPP